MFAEIGMPMSKENVNILKNIHKSVVNVAWETLRNEGAALFADTWSLHEKEKWSYNHYLERCMWNESWLIPYPHKREKWSGYTSRLNAWAWRFVYAHCIDKDEETFKGFFRNLTLIGASSPIGGPYPKDMVYNNCVYHEE